MVSTLAACLIGLSLGLRHAFEPDHLAAVTTLTSEQRSPWAGARLGAFWGLGHTLALVAVAGTLVALEVVMPPRIADGLEFGVGLMLVGLGARAMFRAAKPHPAVPHLHSAPHDHLHLGRWALARRPFLVGLVHGLAGSGALAALVLTLLPTFGARVLYIAVFGLGSVVAMAAMSGTSSVLVGRLARWRHAGSVLLAVAGSCSLGLGLWWGAAAVARVFA